MLLTYDTAILTNQGNYKVGYLKKLSSILSLPCDDNNKQQPKWQYKTVCQVLNEDSLLNVIPPQIRLCNTNTPFKDYSWEQLQQWTFTDIGIELNFILEIWSAFQGSSWYQKQRNKCCDKMYAWLFSQFMFI